MDPILAGVGRVRRRLAAQAYVLGITRGFLIGVLLTLAYVVVDRLVFVGIDLLLATSILMGLPLLGSVIFTTFRLPGRLAAALSLDLRYDLKERVSTAIALGDDPSPVAEAVRADARRRVQELNLSKKTPVMLGGEIRWLAGALIALAIIASPGVLPYFDLFQRAEARERVLKEHDEVKLQAKSLLKKREQLLKKIGDKKLDDVKEALKEWERIALDLQKKPGGRKNALIKMSKLSDAIREKKNSGKFRSLDGIAKALSKNARSSAITKDIQAALKKGDMKAAVEALKALKDKLKNGNLSDEDKAKLAGELKTLSLDLSAAPNLAESLDEAAMDIADDELQAALQDLDEAEMSLEELADAFEELALLEEALAGLESQKKDFWDAGDLADLDIEICEDCGGNLEDALEDLDLEVFGPGPEGDCSACKGKGGDCKECGGTGKSKAHAGKGKGGKGAGKGKSGLGKGKGGGKGKGKGAGKLSCRRCLLAKRRGQGGMGGPGRGQGGQIPDEPDLPGGFEKVKIKGKMGKGKIVGEMLVDGPQAKGEISAEAVEIVGEARQEAADALTKQRIPQGYREFIREYFDSLDPSADK